MHRKLLGHYNIMGAYGGRPKDRNSPSYLASILLMDDQNGSNVAKGYGVDMN